jgi:apolipoprotein N-acyltransferase
LSGSIGARDAVNRPEKFDGKYRERPMSEPNEPDEPAAAAAASTLGDRIARPALALAGGALVALAMPPWGFWPLAIVGVMLFEVSLGDDPSRRQRFLVGYLFGAGWMYLGMGWMIQLTLPGYIVAGSIYAVYHGVAALVAPTGRWRVIGRPAAHALAEALRFSFPFGGVPLASLGISQVAGPFGGVARIGGVILITWVVLQLGFALAGPAPRVPGFARRFRPGASGAPQGLIAFLLIVVVVGLSFVAPTGTPTGETLRVAAVQGGGEQGTSALEVPSSLVTARHLEATRTIADATGDDTDLDLVLWPENTVDVDSFETSQVLADVAAEAARLGAPVALGVTEEAADGDRFVNAQVVVAPNGEVVDRYEKVRRVPFGEYVPLRSLLEALGAPVDQIGRDAVAGTSPAVVELPDGTELAVVISWEVFFGGRAREGVKDGATAILNPTNGSSYTGTIVQTQQVASSRLRAIENGRWVVQAAPTGFTAVIDADGTVLQRTSISEQRVVFADVELRSGNTWYTSLGDAPFICVLVVVLLGSLSFAGRFGGRFGGRFEWLKERSRKPTS